MSWRQRKSKRNPNAKPAQGSRRFLGLIVRNAERAAWQIYDDLKEFQTARPRPWRWPGAVSRKHRRLYADRRAAARKLVGDRTYGPDDASSAPAEGSR